MALEGAGGRELAELVPDHVLGDVDGDELLPVVDGERVTDHLGHDRRTARPGLHHALVPRRVEGDDLLQEVPVHEGAFLCRTRHQGFLRSALLLAALDDHVVSALVVPGLRALGLPAPRGAGVPAAGRLSLAAAHRVVDRVHRDAAVVRLPSQPAVPAGLADRDVLVLEVARPARSWRSSRCGPCGARRRACGGGSARLPWP